MGADCILLIAAASTTPSCATSRRSRSALGMAVLVEVHDERELERALAPARRRSSASTTATCAPSRSSLETTLALLPRVPAGRLVVTESGIRAPADVAPDARRRASHAFLVGEAFMRAADPGVGARRPAAEAA